MIGAFLRCPAVFGAFVFESQGDIHIAHRGGFCEILIFPSFVLGSHIFISALHSPVKEPGLLGRWMISELGQRTFKMNLEHVVMPGNKECSESMGSTLESA